MKSRRKVITIVMSVIGVVLAILLIVVLYMNYKKPTVYIKANDMKYGQEGYLTVKMKNFTEPVAAFDVTLNFDKDEVQVIEVNKGDYDQDVVSTKEMYANEEGKLVLLYIDYTGGDNPLDVNGDTCYIRCKLIKPTDTEINIESISFSDKDGNEITGVVVKGVRIG